jgi:hypothetical protein
MYGEPVEFAVTIPKTVKNIDGAISFVKLCNFQKWFTATGKSRAQSD